MADWSAGQVGLHFIPPGKPWRNIESFNSRIRDECLNVNSFWSLAQARVVITCPTNERLSFAVAAGQRAQHRARSLGAPGPARSSQ
jgi:hypothetical protein